MGSMINPNTDKQGPIRVTEDDKHFLVEIHPNDRDRAKMIPGRQWDGKRVAWVFERAPETYDALVAEFKRDADTFEIRRPKTKRPPGVRQATAEEVEEDFDWSTLEGLGEGQSKLQDEIADIRNALGAFSESFANQERVLEKIDTSQQEIGVQIRNSSDLSESLVGPEIVEVMPDEFNAEDNGHVQLLDNALKQIAVMSSGQIETFEEWLDKHQPLSRPLKFVSDTHELLKAQLEKIVGNADYSDSFYDLIHRAKDENLIYSDRSDPVKVFPILMTLNTIRNRFAHARGEFDESEQWNRSTIYLMNLALIWPRIMIDQDSDE